MAASGVFGSAQACAAIVGHADLKLGDAVVPVLRAQLQAGDGRFRGVRYTTAYDAAIWSLAEPRLLEDKHFRAGFNWLKELGLSFDAMLLEPQLSELIDLARVFPQTSIILNHAGMPLGVGAYAGKQEERFPIWRENIRALAQCPNVVVKLGGLGMRTTGFGSFMANPPFTSQQLAAEWKPYVETCIEAFGAGRCMFESNYPVDSGTARYPVLWNAFKRLAAGASKDEKAALFSGTATRVYRLES
jgi:predicted TIM-barrel fold metal-dependent hydrolase